MTLRHPRMREVTAALWRRDVLPDYRDPDGLRLGLSPLSTSYAEVERGRGGDPLRSCELLRLVLAEALVAGPDDRGGAVGDRRAW